MHENRIPQYVNHMLEKCPYLRKKGFTYPDQSADRLFQAYYRHMLIRSCTKCDLAEQIDRRPKNQPSIDPIIYYRVIATSSSLAKHALTREEIKQSHIAICLELGATGSTNNFPHIVIRRISDYADSHKNDE
jgi:hypothetical protein